MSLQPGTKVKARDGRKFTIICPVMFVPPMYFVEFDDKPGEEVLIDLKVPENDHGLDQQTTHDARRQPKQKSRTAAERPAEENPVLYYSSRRDV
jgi:hypothetical protein